MSKEKQYALICSSMKYDFATEEDWRHVYSVILFDNKEDAEDYAEHLKEERWNDVFQVLEVSEIKKLKTASEGA